MKSAIAIALLVAASGVVPTPAASQSMPPPAAFGAAAPPILSTVPSPAPGAMAEPAQMSGLPLQVGDLPPGTVAVRVIRRSFAENVANQAVELRVGDTGRVVKAVTSQDGRAQFDSLAVGASVRARAVVDGEALESQRFDLPAQGGVRLVLVAGVGAGVAAAGDPGIAAASEPAPSSAPATHPVAAASLLVTLAVATAGVGWQMRRRRRPTKRLQASVVTHAAAARRAEAFESLVQLEKNHREQRVGADAYASSREALVTELMALDSALDRPGSYVNGTLTHD